MEKLKKKVTLRELVEEFKSVSEFSRQYGLDRNSVDNWINFKCLPSSKMMEIIVKKSKGRCTYKSMIESFNMENSK